MRAAPPPTAPEAAGGAGGGLRQPPLQVCRETRLRAPARLRGLHRQAGDGRRTPPRPQPPAVTTQRDASFEPHVVPIAVGGVVRWPNADDIFHNVYSMADTKQFDLGFYKKEKVPEMKFDEVGRVDVFCAIHTKMHCIILVVPEPAFCDGGWSRPLCDQGRARRGPTSCAPGMSGCPARPGKSWCQPRAKCRWTLPWAWASCQGTRPCPCRPDRSG